MFELTWNRGPSYPTKSLECGAHGPSLAYRLPIGAFPVAWHFIHCELGSTSAFLSSANATTLELCPTIPQHRDRIIISRTRITERDMSDSEDQIDIVEDGGDDLFGGDDGDDAASQASERNGRVLSDRDLASEHGDGYDEDDRLQNDEDEDAPVRHINVEKVAMFRHRIPKSKDNQVSLPIPAHSIGAN